MKYLHAPNRFLENDFAVINNGPRSFVTTYIGKASDQRISVPGLQNLLWWSPGLRNHYLLSFDTHKAWMESTTVKSQQHLVFCSKWIMFSNVIHDYTTIVKLRNNTLFFCRFDSCHLPSMSLPWISPIPPPTLAWCTDVFELSYIPFYASNKTYPCH